MLTTDLTLKDLTEHYNRLANAAGKPQVKSLRNKQQAIERISSLQLKPRPIAELTGRTAYDVRQDLRAMWKEGKVEHQTQERWKLAALEAMELFKL